MASSLARALSAVARPSRHSLQDKIGRIIARSFFFFLVTRAASMCVCSSSRNTCRVSVTRERSQNRKKDERQKSTRRDHKTTCLVTAMSSEKTSSRTSRQTARKKQKTLRKSKRDLQMTGRQESTRWENRELTAAMMFLAQRIKRLK